jgi:hypothetical protein
MLESRFVCPLPGNDSNDKLAPTHQAGLILSKEATSKVLKKWVWLA